MYNKNKMIRKYSKKVLRMGNLLITRVILIMIKNVKFILQEVIMLIKNMGLIIKLLKIQKFQQIN